jgi:hypothetical protein
MKFYLKENPANQIHSKTLGKPVPFEYISKTLAVFKTEDAGLQAEFAAAISANRYGLREIQEAEYDAYLKKKPALPESWFRSPPGREEIGGFQAMDTSPRPQTPTVAAPAAVAEAVNPAIAADMPAIQKPRLGRPRKVHADAKI